MEASRSDDQSKLIDIGQSAGKLPPSPCALERARLERLGIAPRGGQ